VSEAEDIARSRDFLRQGVGTTTRRNRVLPAARLPSPIPARVGKAGPREEVGTYVEVDYALRVLETDNSMTYHYDMLNTPLDGNMRLYLQPRPRETTAGDANYYASAVKLTTTDGLLKTDYQLTLQEAMIRPASGSDRVAGFGAAPVTDWFADFDLIRGPTGVHALVKKPRKVDMLVDGTPETLTLKPPPYTKPAGNGLCVLDEILKLGDPWHGLIQGVTVRLPGGKTRPVARPGIGVGVVYPLIPYGVTPAATADAADVAAGRTWLNYGLLAGACLYEQSITTGAPSWVYIAPDNTTWRVLCTASTLLGVQTLTLSFYPLRKMFLTTDKWGGLAQTLQVQINPTTSAYGFGTLYDLDSKGANAVFFNPTGAAAGGALLNIQGIPPSATATYTLLCAASLPQSDLYAMYKYEGVALVETKSWIYRTVTFNQLTSETTYGGELTYLQNILAGDPPLTDFLPPIQQPPEWWITITWQWGWTKKDEASIALHKYIVGYAFDAADAIQEVIFSFRMTVDFSIRPKNNDYYAPEPPGPVEELTGNGGLLQYEIAIGSLTAPAVEWFYDGYRVTSSVPNKYGQFVDVNQEGGRVEAVRYSNRVYGLSVSSSADAKNYWLPPISPDVVSAYPADIFSAGKPFATYHPVTKQLVWETGFVNFV
jgi:hypothetical protein